MRNESVTQSLVAFIAGLPRAAGILHFKIIYMLLALLVAGNTLEKVMTNVMGSGRATTLCVLILEAVAFWLSAFALGVKIRPPRDIPEYPPIRLLGCFLLLGLIPALVLGASLATATETSMIKALSLSLASFLGLLFLLVVMFAANAPRKNQLAWKMGDMDLLIADAYQATWLFSGTALLTIWFFLPRESESASILHIVAVILHISVATAVALTGFASGFYR